MTATSPFGGFNRISVNCIFNIFNLYLLMVLFFVGVILYSICTGGTVLDESDVMYLVQVSLIPGITFIAFLGYMFFGYFEDDSEEVKKMRRERIKPAVSLLVHVDKSGKVLERWEQGSYMVVGTHDLDLESLDL